MRISGIRASSPESYPDREVSFRAKEGQEQEKPEEEPQEEPEQGEKGQQAAEPAEKEAE